MITYDNLIKTTKVKIPLFAIRYDDMLHKDIIDKEAGNHIVFNYVFTPILIDLIENKEEEEIKKFFSFVEEMASSEDIRVTEVCDQSILELLYDEFGDDIEEYFGEKTKEGFNAIKEYMN